MQVNVEELEYCKYKVNYTADTNIVSKKTKEAVDNLRHVRIPGFRPGKATDTAIKLRFKDRITQWVKNEMLNHANDDILFETKMVPIGKPQVEKSTLDGNNFSCDMVYLKKPEFELCNVKELEIPEPHMEKNEEGYYKEILDNLLEARSSVNPYEDDDVVQFGDKVTMDIVIDGEENEGQLFIVGSEMPEGFNEGIVGMKPGETREFKVKKDDKAVDCSVTVHMGMKVKLPEVNEELAKEFGLKSVEDFDKSVLETAKRRYNDIRSNMIADQIKLKLVEKHDFECPPWLVNMEAQYMASLEKKNFESLSEEEREVYMNRGRDNVKFSLILDTVRNDEPESLLSDEETVRYIQLDVSQKGVKNVDAWMQQAAQSGQLHGLISKYKNNFTMKWLIDNVKVVA